MRKAQADVAVLTARVDEMAQHMEQQQKVIMQQQQQLRTQAVAIVELGGSSKLITSPFDDDGGESVRLSGGGRGKKGCVVQ
jgi:hypothetical protein